jgi:hypothetical protein
VKTTFALIAKLCKIAVSDLPSYLETAIPYWSGALGFTWIDEDGRENVVDGTQYAHGAYGIDIT